MFVKLKNGPHAGQAVEMRYADAKPLFDDGRAERAFPPDPAPVAKAKPIEAAPRERPAIRKSKKK